MEYEVMMEHLVKNGFSTDDAKQGGVSFLGSQRDLQAAATFLEEDEIPMAIAAGEFYYAGSGINGVNNAIIVLTNERILKVDKKIKNTDMAAYFVEDVNSSKLNTSFLSSQLVIATTSSSIVVSKVKKDTARKFHKVLIDLIRETKKGKKNGGGTTVNHAASGMDEILKAKKLLDAGIIDEKEFAALKKKHLG